MKLTDNWIENYNKFNKKQKLIRITSNVITGVVVAALIITYYYIKQDVDRLPPQYFGAYVIAIALGNYSNKLLQARRRSEIYIDILEKNIVLSVEIIKERVPRKLISIKNDDVIVYQVNKDLKLLRKYGVVDVSDEDLLKVL